MRKTSRGKMSDRKFYKTVITVEVLSEEPVAFGDLGGLHCAITEGGCSGDYTEGKTKTLSAKQAVRELLKQGSDPSFFRLTETGADAE
jgi:hypothetical protein